MANTEYDVGTAILGILDSYMDNKSQERIAYAKMNKPEIREVDGNLVAVNPTTLKVTPLTGGTDHYMDKTQKVLAEATMNHGSDDELMSSQGGMDDFTDSILNNPIGGKTDYDNRVKPGIKRINKLAEYNVIAQYKNLIATSDIAPADFKSVFYDMFGGVTIDHDGSPDRYLPETWETDSEGVETVNQLEDNPEYNRNHGKSIGTYGMLSDVIRTGNLKEQEAFIQNVKSYIRKTKTKRLQSKIAESRAIKRALVDQERVMRKAHAKAKGYEGNIYALIDVDAEDSDTKKALIEAVKEEAQYLRIKYDGRTVVDPVNYIDMQLNKTDNKAVQFQGAMRNAVKRFSTTGEKDAQGKEIFTDWWKNFLEDKTNFKSLETGNKVYSAGGLSKIIKKLTEYRRNQGDSALTIEQTIPLVHDQLWIDLDDKVFNGLHESALNDIDVSVQTMMDMAKTAGWN